MKAPWFLNRLDRQLLTANTTIFRTLNFGTVSHGIHRSCLVTSKRSEQTWIKLLKKHDPVVGLPFRVGLESDSLLLLLIGSPSLLQDTQNPHEDEVRVLLTWILIFSLSIENFYPLRSDRSQCWAVRKPFEMPADVIRWWMDSRRDDPWPRQGETRWPEGRK